MGALADGGRMAGVDILTPAAIAAMAAERITGQDLVLPFVMSWGAGVMRNPPNHPWGLGANTFGHSGWGGACAFADPDARLGGAYVMNRQGSVLLGDTRPKRLIAAAYAGL
jgi:CubicO group peptidase (beta-lactamase class C family)